MRKILLAVLLLPLILVSKNLQISDLDPTMQKLFDLHVEYKELDETVLKRWFKLYIDHFDPGKVYLLNSEIKQHLFLSSKESKNIINRINNNDFSDFIALNKIFQNAILRSRTIRAKLYEEINAINQFQSSLDRNSTYATSVKELEKRQKNSLLRYYFLQNEKFKIDSLNKKQKVQNLIEKKMVRFENNYLMQNSKGVLLTEQEQNQIMALKIIKAFAKSLDAHSAFFSYEEALEMRIALEKEFEGLGIVLSESIEGVVIADLVKNSPADKSKKIQPNDILLEINQVSLAELDFDDVLDLLKAKNNNLVALKLKRMQNNAPSIVYVELQRGSIVMDDERLTYSTEKYEDGYILKMELKAFYENVGGISSEKDIKNAIRNVRKMGTIKGIVLDLRDNAGGFLSQAVKVAGLFITNGIVVIAKNGKKEISFLRTLSDKAFYNGSLVVLTSKLSASASEIVAQALQDYGVALIVGDEATFGKGSIQYQTVTDANTDFFYKVTIGKYYTVSGRSTQIEGVKADIVIPSKYASLKIGEKYLDYPLKADKVAAVYSDPLTDVDPKARFWLKQTYSPLIQRKVVYWNKMLPTLKQNSQNRQQNDSAFKEYLNNCQNPKFLENNPFGQSNQRDFQMEEGVNIIKDMINIQSSSLQEAANF